MNDFDQYLTENKQTAYDIAENNTVRNKDGRAVISKDDEWMQETEWDEFWKDISEKELEKVTRHD